MMKIVMVHLAAYAKNGHSGPSQQPVQEVSVWVDTSFTMWEKAIEKMKSRKASKLHLDSCQAALLSSQAPAHGTVAQQLQQINEGQRKTNREAVKVFIRRVHYLARHHIAHTTNYDDLVGLMVSCGAQPLTDTVKDAAGSCDWLYRSNQCSFTAESSRELISS